MNNTQGHLHWHYLIGPISYPISGPVTYIAAISYDLYHILLVVSILSHLQCLWLHVTLN